MTDDLRPDRDRLTMLGARLIIALALAKLLVGAIAALTAAALGSLGAVTLPPVVTAAVALTYAGVGVALALGGLHDVRCRALGLFLLIAGTAFGDSLAVRGHALGGLTRFMISVHLDVLLPALLWWFVRDFPTRLASGWLVRVPALAGAAALMAGVGLLLVNLVVDAGNAAGVQVPSALLPFSRTSGNGWYWPALFILMVPAAPVMLAKALRAPAPGRQQVWLFVMAILIGLLPISLDVVLEAVSPVWLRFMDTSPAAVVVNAAIVVAFLSVPFSTAYAVLVARVADLRLILRTALQYAMARYTVIALIALPLVWLVQFVYANRVLTVEQLLFSRSSLGLLAGLVAAGLALYLRQRVLDHLDRRFFREHYDTQRVLQGVFDVTRSPGSGERLAERLAAEVDRALHVDRLAVMLRDDTFGQFVATDGSAPPVRVSSIMVRLLSASDEPLEVDPEDPESVMHRFDAEDTHWLVDNAFRMLVPMRAHDGVLQGMLALGEKKSELPYSRADRLLLTAVGASGGVRLGRTGSGRATTAGGPVAAPSVTAAATECPACGLVHDTEATTCSCGTAVQAGPVPRVLADKFKLECRVGAGGMGVVYRAHDLMLGRTVAIKTLPLSSPSETWRLRREARAMALVSHEHLALIYGAESWHGLPFLIVEFLPGGTLTQRLRRDRMPVDEMRALGVLMADVLDTLHAAGLLHRDLKPSNIGYSASGKAKLLDFGLAQLFATAGADSTAGESSTGRANPLSQATHHGFGTLAYMSPEALNSAVPSVSFDLWSLAVVLVESVSGVNPFAGATPLETVQRISRHDEGSVPAMLPGCSAELVAFFKEALHPDPKHRPPTAREFGRRLAGLGYLP